MASIGFGIFILREDLDLDLIDEDRLDITGPFHENLFNEIYQYQDFDIDTFSVLDGREPEDIIFIGRILDPDRFDLVDFKTIAEVNAVMLEVCDFLDEVGIDRLTEPSLCILDFGI